ncbi:PKD domain-containing protein [Sediminitomix flava]|uniref:PKD domain-containing protein n=1 Tax=Sediminitomix flava TaxID=379075 RepID=A0A315ZGW0_SEDFL|nr:PKD domain-containing protein [Sediminitomix flava]PWJ44403.1 PKD domain-containing protein [Sediminitomix flava]
MKKSVLNRLKFAGIFALAIGMGACQTEDSESLPITAGLKLANEVTVENPLEAPANVVVINASKNAVSHEWSFPEGYLKNDLNKADSYSGLTPDTIRYDLPGSYTINLDVTDANGVKESTSLDINVVKPMPKLLMDKEAIEMQDSVTFSAKVFTYEGKDVSYSWDFGNGETFTESSVKMAWEEAGMYHILLTVNDGEEVLNSTFEVEVKPELAQGLYFHDLATGKIFRKPLTVRTETEAMATEFSAAHAMDLEVADGKVYVFDAGEGSFFLGSGTAGQLYAFDVVSKEMKVILDAISANNVPYAGTVEGNNVYYLDRREGFRSINKFTENLAEADLPAHFVKNNTLTAFYNSTAQPGEPGGIGWGNMNGDGQLVGDKFYWSKANNGQSIYTFSRDGKTAHDRLLAGVSVKTFKVYKDKIYFAVNVPSTDPNTSAMLKTGLYMCDLNGTNVQEIESYEASEFDQFGNLEGLSYSCLVGITGIAIDEMNDKIYWSYRSADQAPETSGVKRANLDGSEVEMYLSGYAPMGMAIDPVRR